MSIFWKVFVEKARVDFGAKWHWYVAWILSLVMWTCWAAYFDSKLVGAVFSGLFIFEVTKWAHRGIDKK